MTKFSLRARQEPDRAASAARPEPTPSRTPQSTGHRAGSACDLYDPGHQMHYRHQGDAVRSRALSAHEMVLDGTLLIVALDDGRELEWRHHDPGRVRRVLEAVPGKRVVYPDFHALRVGPYWFNCARETDEWQDCRARAESRV